MYASSTARRCRKSSTRTAARDALHNSRRARRGFCGMSRKAQNPRQGFRLAWFCNAADRPQNHAPCGVRTETRMAGVMQSIPSTPGRGRCTAGMSMRRVEDFDRPSPTRRNDGRAGHGAAERALVPQRGRAATATAPTDTTQMFHDCTVSRSSQPGSGSGSGIASSNSRV